MQGMGCLLYTSLSVYLERQMEDYAQAFSALQSGTHTASDALNLISSLFVRGGQLDNAAQALRPPQAYGFLADMLAAQARAMGFRESFFLVGLAFFAAVIPAWFMRSARRG